MNNALYKCFIFLVFYDKYHSIYVTFLRKFGILKADNTEGENVYERTRQNPIKVNCNMCHGC